jgi:hypothetical protein
VQDVDVGVAQQAARGLVELSKQLTHLQLFLSKQGCGSKLADMAQRADAIVRSRLFSLVVDIADSSPQAAELVAESGKSKRCSCYAWRTSVRGHCNPLACHLMPMFA